MPIDVKFDEEKRLLRVTVSGAWPTLRDGSQTLMTSATAS
jgi:hypothetical protein